MGEIAFVVRDQNQASGEGMNRNEPIEAAAPKREPRIGPRRLLVERQNGDSDKELPQHIIARRFDVPPPPQLGGGDRRNASAPFIALRETSSGCTIGITQHIYADVGVEQVEQIIPRP